VLSVRRFQYFHSAGIRFAATYAGLLAVSGAALALFLWWATAGLLDRQTEAAITTDALGLSERWADGGLRSLVATIGDRLAGNIDDDAVYLLADSTYGQIAGNLDCWPPSVRQAGQFYELQVVRGGMRSLARVQAYDLPQGYHLLIGRDVVVRSQLRQLLTDALLWAMVIVCGLAWIGAFVVRGMFRRTLASVSDTAQAIAGGDLTQRVRLTGRGDEFDQLAEVINDMLDRIGRLMEGVRQVSHAIAHDLAHLGAAEANDLHVRLPCLQLTQKPRGMGVAADFACEITRLKSLECLLFSFATRLRTVRVAALLPPRFCTIRATSKIASFFFISSELRAISSFTTVFK
jgi:hypothetical protein